MSLTAAQQQAITARGNVLVVAGAGTGKTRTLVERCLSCLIGEQPPASMDEILVVTFTEAAAAEMRQRIRLRLEEESQKRPGDSRWQEELALFDTAHIGTLHSFCLKLVREHFYELGIDPQLSVLAQEEARLLSEETLDSILQSHYAGRSSPAEAVQQLIQVQGRGADKLIRALVLQLHHYTQTLPDPAGWLQDQIRQFASPDPAQWRVWLAAAIPDWRERWLPLLERLRSENEVAEKSAAALAETRAFDPGEVSSELNASVLGKVIAAANSCPKGKKTVLLKPLEEFLEETKFLYPLVSGSGETEALAEDWGWVRSQMTALLELAREFSTAFAEAKKELGMVDFHDLEQFALKLLWDLRSDQPTQIARQWRETLRFVFVDEYQDINAAQDRIIQALSRDDAQANRFLVGDAKQSIYRFRLANPRIFQRYLETWHDGRGCVIPLVDNFRSREGVLNFVNALFGLLMLRELGGLAYDEQAKLKFGARDTRRPRSLTDNGTDAKPHCVELHLRVKGEIIAGSNSNREQAPALLTGSNAAASPLPVPDPLSPVVPLAVAPSEGTAAQEFDDGSEGIWNQILDLEESAKEARLIALRLAELKTQRHSVWDEQTGAFRPVDWRDMAILLRSPANKSESYAKEFSRLGVPLLVARGGFYQSLEISDLLNLLALLDNPLQDVPVLAVLRSPLVGLTLNEMAAIRLAGKGPFWTALLKWHERSEERGAQPGSSAAAAAESDWQTLRKVSEFLDRFTRWRRLARQVSLSRCLQTVLAETHYAEWLLTQPRGEQSHANVQRLIALARQFDEFQRQSLFRFLLFVEAQRLAETEPEVGMVSEENSVRLLSIHQSKGLEFPVVVVADLGKPFNLSDLRADVILDEVYGLCPQIKPPHTGRSYPSLPYWLACQRQRRELLGEELRLLYVAMTRARDLLILSATLSKNQFKRLREPADETGNVPLQSARSFADWIGQWFTSQCAPIGLDQRQGENSFLRWVVHDPGELSHCSSPIAAEADKLVLDDLEAVRRVKDRLEWSYPFLASTRKPAKTSVTMLRRQAAGRLDEEAVERGPRPEVRWPQFAIRGSQDKTLGGIAADSGTAHHEFLRFVALDRVGSGEDLRREAQRLIREKLLMPEAIALLDFEALAGFWNSDLGQKIRARSQFVQRELAFTARFAPAEIAALTGESPELDLESEFVVVQGVADLVVMLPAEIWLLDFKTDRIEPGELDQKVDLYEPQLKLYARALSRIFKRPVSQCWLYFLRSQTAAAILPV